MNTLDRHEEIIDKLIIADLIQFERLHRDQHHWEQLKTMYHADSEIRLGWFVGTGVEYVEASRRMEEKKGCWHLTHLMSPTQVQVHHDRAIAETNALIIRRAALDGVLVDFTICCHFYTRVERREGTWRILKMDVIYEKDSLALVNPSDHLNLSWEALEQGPAAYRFSAYHLKKLGYTVRAVDLYSTDQAERIAQLFHETELWLAYEDTSS